MISNKQINIWRGPDPPPTKYHIWFKDEAYLLSYNEEVQDWLVFLDSRGLVDKIADVINQLNELANFTINGKDIKDNPILDGDDLKLNYSGNYVKENDTLKQAIITLDKLLTTKIYNGQ